MTIKREDLDRREVDFSDVASGRRLLPVHPGEILRDEFLTPMEMSVYRLAQAIKVSRPRLNDIVLGRRGITTDTALRLGRYFGMTPEFWINLQTRYDLDVAERTTRRQIESAPQPSVTVPNESQTHATHEDTIAQLERLAKLREQGVLDEKEFQEQKNKILHGSG